MSQAAILYTDIKNSTKLARNLGDAVYKEQIRTPHFQALEEEITRHNGVIYQDKGDGVIAYFPDAEQAVAAAVTLQNRLRARPTKALDADGQSYAIAVRMGLHTGSADANGRPDTNPLNYASRIEALADAEQIILSEAAFQALETPPYPCKPWRNRYLKGVETLETVYELDYDGVRRKEPGTRFIPGEYVEPANRYIEREELQDRIFNAFNLTQGQGVPYRLFTLHGEGGMGKTRMAVTCAVRMAGLFQDHVYFVSLAETAPTRQSVVRVLLSALGLPEQEEQGSGEAAEKQEERYLLAFLRHHDQMLLILDNFESVKSGEVQHLLIDMLNNAPMLRLLVTSRSLIDITDLEYPIDMDKGMTDEEAAGLFLEWANRSGQSNRPPIAPEDPQLARILMLTEHIPLALELTGAWAARVLTLVELADGLEETPLRRWTETPSNATRSDSVSTHGRHDSLLRSHDWSWNLLAPSERNALIACGLFAGSFTPSALDAVMDEKCFDLVNSLQTAALLKQDYSCVPPRYRLHRFTRAYAQRKQAAPANREFAAAVEVRFILHYVKLITARGSLLEAAGAAAGRQAQDLLDAEWLNAAAAFQTAIQRQEWDSVERLFLIHDFLYIHGKYALLEQLADTLVREARKADRKRLLGFALNALGIVYNAQGKWQEAEAAWRENLVLRRSRQDETGESKALLNLGTLYHSLGRLEQAETAYRDSLRLCEKLEDEVGIAMALSNLGDLLTDQNKWAEAEDAVQKSLVLSQRSGHLAAQALEWDCLGRLYLLQGREKWVQAEESLQNCLALCHGKVVLPMYEAQALFILAQLRQAQGRNKEAFDFAQSAAQIWKQTEAQDKQEEVHALIMNIPKDWQ